jgi:NH3-dependent NAD+ synthetase
MLTDVPTRPPPILINEVIPQGYRMLGAYYSAQKKKIIFISTSNLKHLESYYFTKQHQ